SRAFLSVSRSVFSPSGVRYSNRLRPSSGGRSRTMRPRSSSLRTMLAIDDRSSATDDPNDPCSTPGYAFTAVSTANCGPVSTGSTSRTHAAVYAWCIRRATYPGAASSSSGGGRPFDESIPARPAAPPVLTAPAKHAIGHVLATRRVLTAATRQGIVSVRTISGGTRGPEPVQRDLPAAADAVRGARWRDRRRPDQGRRPRRVRERVHVGRAEARRRHLPPAPAQPGHAQRRVGRRRLRAGYQPRSEERRVGKERRSPSSHA